MIGQARGRRDTKEDIPSQDPVESSKKTLSPNLENSNAWRHRLIDASSIPVCSLDHTRNLGDETRHDIPDDASSRSFSEPSPVNIYGRTFPSDFASRTTEPSSTLSERQFVEELTATDPEPNEVSRDDPPCDQLAKLAKKPTADIASRKASIHHQGGPSEVIEVPNISRYGSPTKLAAHRAIHSSCVLPNLLSESMHRQRSPRLTAFTSLEPQIYIASPTLEPPVDIHRNFKTSSVSFPTTLSFTKFSVNVFRTTDMNRSCDSFNLDV